MTAKKDLDNLFGNDDTPKKPVIRRGQGLRLSTEDQAEPSPTTVVEAETVEAETGESNARPPRKATAAPALPKEQPKKRTKAKSPNRTNAKVRNRADIPVRHKRVNRGYMLREDLIKACKQIALDENRKLYEVMEEALAQYLTKKKKS